jgi:hypothetical protein
VVSLKGQTSEEGPVLDPDTRQAVWDPDIGLPWLTGLRRLTIWIVRAPSGTGLRGGPSSERFFQGWT